MAGVAVVALKAALYCRVSTPGQESEGTSLATQLDACRAYAGQQGYEVAGEYIEVHTGAQLWERPRLNDLRERIRRREVQVVIAYALDRLSRSQTHLGVLLDEADRYDVRFELVTESLEKSAVGTFLASARTFAAELEREKIAERTMRGKRAMLAAGKPMRGPAPYGYAWNAERRGWDVAEPAASVVRRIFAELAAGGSITALCRALSNEGVPTPRGGRQWWPSWVARLIRHPIYAGRPVAWRTHQTKTQSIIRPESEWIDLPPEVAPALVSPEVWQRALARVAENRILATRNNSHPDRYLLRGFVYCGLCGRRMWTTHNELRRSWQYFCGGYKQPVPWCTARIHIAARYLDIAAWERLVDQLSAALGNRRARPRQPDHRQRIEAIAATLADLERRQRNLVAALSNVDATLQGPLIEQLTALQTQMTTLRAERDRLSTAAEPPRITRALVAVARDPECSDETKRGVLRALGVRVYVYSSEAAERFTLDY